MPSPLEMAGKSPKSTTGGNSAVSLSILDTGRKRRSESSRTGPDSISGSRKSGKVSRACDYCKSKKLKCSGTVPCTICSKRELACQYHSLYRRGRPPTPPRAPDLRPNQLSTNYAPSSGNPSPSGAHHTTAPGPRAECGQTGGIGTPIGVTAVSEHSQLESTEIEGQIVDSTSNLNFMHRAWRRLALQTRSTLPSLLTTPEQQQSLTCAGDRPFKTANKACIDFRDTEEATAYLDYYFDNCVVTYRLLHRQTCRAIRDSVLSSAQAGRRPENEVGHAKVSLISCIFAIAILRKSKLLNHDSSAGVGDRNGVASAIQLSELYFENARRLSQMETGYPKLESVQSRVLQVLYLLQTSRMNEAWYIFGTVITILSALGLHRKATKQGSGPGMTGCGDYIATQCSRRTFWVVYTIDKYLAVVFGRPRFLHDDEINQDFPDLVNDEDMTSEGPADTEPRTDCNVDSLIFHARIARIIGGISRDVYSLQITSDAERLPLAESYTGMLREWLHELPPHLGSVRPSSLVPGFRRQCMALKLAYSHAVMHANRPFLLENAIPTDSLETERRVEDCMGGAKMALETVEHMVSDGSLFHSLWWTPYVAFCALAVVYVWEIQHRSTSFPDKQRNSALLALAERCQGYLTQSLPDESLSRRYGIILEELRLEAKQSRHCDAAAQAPEAATGQQSASRRCLDANMATTNMPEPTIRASDPDEFQSTSNLLSQWQPTDWLDLDSSVLNFFNEVDGSYPLV